MRGRQPHGSNVYDELAHRFAQLVRDVHANDLPGVERFQVHEVAPFRIGEVQGDLVLEDGDPDFTLGETLRDRITAGKVHVGDLVWVARHSGDWHALDVVSS